MTSSPDNTVEKILSKFVGCKLPHPKYMTCEWCDELPEAKQAITSLMKELVEEVIGEDEWSGIFPGIGESSAMRDDLRADQRTRLQSILKREFEQNLLKALEEV